MRAEATTIKVSKPLRDRLAQQAAREGRTAAGLIADLLDERERVARFRAVARAHAGADEAYREEAEAWDVLNADGLSE